MGGDRKALRVDAAGKVVSVLSESTFSSERALHEAIADHPEVLPHDDLGLGPLVTLGSEVLLRSGPLDLLLVDPQGRLALCEFKKGTENPDARKVVAQLLDYGAGLWGMSYDELEAAAQRSRPPFVDTMVDHVRDRVPDGVTFDEEAFVAGVSAGLSSGAFSFLYVVRDLDERTRRLMTYLAEGPRMTFFAIEVDHFTAEDGAVLVPRTAFLPKAALERRPARRDPAADDLIARMDDVARRLGVPVIPAETGRRYAGPGTSYIGVYHTTTGIQFALKPLREAGHRAVADRVTAELEAWLQRPLRGAGEYPNFRCGLVLADWDHLRERVIEPFLTAGR